MGGSAEVVFGRGANRLGMKRELFEDATLAGVALEDFSLVFALLGGEGWNRRRHDRRRRVGQKTFGFEAGWTGMIRGKLEQREVISKKPMRGMDGGRRGVVIRMSSFVRMRKDRSGPYALKNLDEIEGNFADMKARPLIGPFQTEIPRAGGTGYFERTAKFKPAKSRVFLPGATAGIANVIAGTWRAVSNVYNGGEFKPGEPGREANRLIVGMRSDDNDSAGHWSFEWGAILCP